MLHELADMREAAAAAGLPLAPPPLPASPSLRDDAASIAASILDLLYVPPNGSAFSGGYFSALYPNGTLQARVEEGNKGREGRVLHSCTLPSHRPCLQGVRHVMDYVYVTQFLGVNRSSSSSSGGRPAYIPPGVAAEMGAFVARELLALPWMRALSLRDPAAPFSNRSDHGPSGAYLG